MLKALCLPPIPPFDSLISDYGKKEIFSVDQYKTVVNIIAVVLACTRNWCLLICLQNKSTWQISILFEVFSSVVGKPKVISEDIRSYDV